jgi:hypothetical protein
LAETKAALQEARAARETAIRQVERLAQQVKALKEAAKPPKDKDGSDLLRAIREVHRTLKASADVLRAVDTRSTEIMEAMDGLPERLDRIETRVGRMGAQELRASAADGNGRVSTERPVDDAAPVEDDPRADESWQEQFDRIERAWLAGHLTGDLHDMVPFQESARLLRHAQQHLRDDERLLTEMDALRGKFGEGFSYCIVYTALRELRKPSLTSPVLLVKMREIHQKGFCRSHVAA